MTITEAATRLFAYFSPEERSIPDSDDYPGRNAAVAGALNGALQMLFGEGGQWVRKDDRGALLYAPAEITVGVVNEGTAFSISAGWESWMEGCSIVIEGHDADNTIKSTSSAGYAALTVNPTGTNNTFTLTATNTGSSGNLTTFEIADAEFIPELLVEVSGQDITITPVRAISIGGTLTSNGTTPAVFPPLILAGDSQFTSDGNETPPASGSWYEYVKAIGTWVARKFVDGAEVAFWESSFADPQQTDPLDPTIDLTAASPATGTPMVSSVVASTAQEVIDAMNADASCSSLVTTEAAGNVTGIVAAYAQTALSGGSNIALLKIPYGGESGTKSAMVYHDSIALGTDVMALHDPVKANGIPLVMVQEAGESIGLNRSRDYGFCGSLEAMTDLLPVSQTGQPRLRSVTTWTRDATTPEMMRMNISPAPAEDGTLTYTVQLLPPVVSDLSSTSTLPIPYGMAESVFLPIATMQLWDSPFFRGTDVPNAIADKYKLAMQSLGKRNPSKSNHRFIAKG